MICVRFAEKTVTISGHAGYAKRGEDIVCAAMSTLVYVQTRILEKAEALASLATTRCSTARRPRTL